MLDEFEASHPEITVTRLRPALVFKADAASDIQRYSLTRWMPLQALKVVRPLALPIPSCFRGMHAVHAEGLGRA